MSIGPTCFSHLDVSECMVYPQLKIMPFPHDLPFSSSSALLSSHVLPFYADSLLCDIFSPTFLPDWFGAIYQCHGSLQSA